MVKGVTKQPLLLLSSMLSREKQATPQFLQVAGLLKMREDCGDSVVRLRDGWPLLNVYVFVFFLTSGVDLNLSL